MAVQDKTPRLVSSVGFPISDGVVRDVKFSTGSGGGGDPYVTTAKFFDTYFTNYAKYTRSSMWPSDNGSLFTFAAFFKIPDQPDYKNNRIFLGGLNNYLTMFIRQWDNYTDAGLNTNRFMSYVANTSGDGYSEIHYGNEVSGLNAGDWLTFMFSIDYSGAAPVVHAWVQKTGESTAYSISPDFVLDDPTGPIVYDWDSTTVETSFGSHENYSGDAGEYDACEIYITNEAVDWSDSATRLKYVDSEGKPVGLGSDGSGLTGTAAKHYAPDGDLSNNRGTESNWTASGTISDSSTSPTD